MIITTIGKGPGHFEIELQQKAQELMDVLDKGDLTSAMDVIQELHGLRHQTFFKEVGHLTRGLHEAIKAFSTELGSSLEMDNEDIMHEADAADRLNYVIKITEKNAHETMDRIDKALSFIDGLDNQSAQFSDLLSLVGQLEKEHSSLDGVYERTCTLKSESESTIKSLRTELTDILVSQSYQDITGQLIRRVISLVTNVETHLVGLMEMAAKVEKLSGIGVSELNETSEADAQDDKQNNSIRAEGPQIQKSRSDVASNQDEVDDLLSSLGF